VAGWRNTTLFLLRFLALFSAHRHAPFRVDCRRLGRRRSGPFGHATLSELLRLGGTLGGETLLLGRHNRPHTQKKVGEKKKGGEREKKIRGSEKRERKKNCTSVGCRS
jgi:hypothetical protein